MRWVGFTFLIFAAVLCCGAASANRAFDVVTSIGMTTLSDPDQFSRTPGVRFSPDGRYFVIVSSRGVLARDEIESTLRLFRTRDVLDFIHGRGRVSIGGTVLAVRLAVPKTSPVESYAPVISDVAWTADSKSVLYLVQDAKGERRLYETAVTGRISIALSPPGYDVQAFAANATRAAFSASDSAKIAEIEAAAPGSEIDPDARDVTGVPIWTILRINSDRGFIERTLPVFRVGAVNLGAKHATSNRPGDLSSLGFGSMQGVLALSPDGKRAVELLPDYEFPAAWNRYRFGMASFASICVGKRLTYPPGICTPKLYFAIDLHSGLRTPLLAAPYGSAYGYSDAAIAKWSPDGRLILLTGTFLPLSDAPLRSRDPNRDLCSAALYDVAVRQAKCIRYSAYDRDMSDADPRKLVLTDAEIEDFGKQIDLTFVQGSLGLIVAERYRETAGVWQKIGSSTRRVGDQGGAASEGAAERLRIWIKQDLDRPPQLWATDTIDGKSVELWDPNPALNGVALGHASVYRWKDPSGHEWIGGLVKPVGYVPGRHYPLVIQTYTFAQHQFLADGMDTTAEAAMPLASAGMMVLQVQKRFDFTLTDREAAIQVSGFEAAIAQLVRDGLVDPVRVGIIGFSRGAYYAISALIAKPASFAAATVADGLDQSYMQHRIFEVAALQDESTYGADPDGTGLANWIRLAPGFNLDKVHAPVRVEAIGPISILQEWELYSSLREQHKPADLIYLPDGQHILRKPLERWASQQGDVDWFRFWLQGYEDPAPHKAAQYRRWEHFCDLQIAEKTGRPTFCVPTRH